MTDNNKNKRIEELEKENAELKKDIAELRARLDSALARINELERIVLNQAPPVPRYEVQKQTTTFGCKRVTRSSYTGLVKQSCSKVRTRLNKASVTAYFAENFDDYQILLQDFLLYCWTSNFWRV